MWPVFVAGEMALAVVFTVCASREWVTTGAASAAMVEATMAIGRFASIFGLRVLQQPD
jgi:hypothetical protein